jgi:hypothetical protein
MAVLSSRICSPGFVQNEVHDEFCQNIRSERRQKNQDGKELHAASLFQNDLFDLYKDRQFNRKPQVVFSLFRARYILDKSRCCTGLLLNVLKFLKK